MRFAACDRAVFDTLRHNEQFAFVERHGTITHLNVYGAFEHPRASFAMMLAILPASATIIGAVVLAQFPSLRDVIGIILVMTGVALHRPARTT